MRAADSPYNRRFFALPAIALIGIYAALMLLAAACPADPALPGSGHRHHHTAHHDKAAHTLLCAWACQISSPSTVIALQHVLWPALFLIGVLLNASLCDRSTNRALIRTRAPPPPFCSN
jgi:hypothetical protein